MKPINMRMAFIPKNSGNAYFDSLSDDVSRAVEEMGGGLFDASAGPPMSLPVRSR